MNKKIMSFLLATATALTLVPTLASAQEAPSSTASEYRGEKPSQINGVPIKVGEHNEYYYDYKKFNIAINPLGPAFGWYSASASVALSNRVAIRGDIMLFQPPGSDDEELTSVGLGATIYFKKMYSGFFVEPGIGNYSAGNGKKDNVTGPQVLMGWHWNWDSGLNAMAGFGAMRGTGDDIVLPKGVLKVGYNF